MKQLSKLVQTDNPGSNSYSFISTVECYTYYATTSHYFVADVDEESNVSKTTCWNGNAKFPHRLLFDEPEPGKGNFNTVQLAKVAKTDLTDNAQKLIGRLLTELKLYLMQISKQQLLAIATNPLTATLGIDQLMGMTLLLADNKVTNNINYRKKSQ